MEKKNWNDITLDKFLKLQSILEVQDAYTTCNIIDLIYDINSANIPLTEFVKYVDAIRFLNTEIKPLKKVSDTITLNGKTYRTNGNLTQVNVAQYIDYQNYCKRENPQYQDILSVFVIPEGHQYNDGYDIAEVKTDILQMPIDIVVTLAFFFTTQFQAFIQIFPIYFKEEVKKMKITENQKKEILEALDKVDFNNLASYLTLQESVKNLMRVGKV